MQEEFVGRICFLIILPAHEQVVLEISYVLLHIQEVSGMHIPHT